MATKISILLCFLLVCTSCNNSTNTEVKNNTENPVSVSTDGEEFEEEEESEEGKGHRWAPLEFKQKHPDEWVVVEQSINIQQQDLDYSKIDTLVKAYISKKNIELPSDKSLKIKKIEEICQKRFDISDYDNTNWGMHIASGTKRLFESYINWLYQQEAEKILSKNKFVDIKKDFELYQNLNNAMFAICDSVEGCMEGSGGWSGAEQIDNLLIDYKKLMLQAIVDKKYYGASIEMNTEFIEVNDVLALFDKECSAYIANFKPFGETPSGALPLANRFRKAYHSWYTYRKSESSKLEDEVFKKVYNSITLRHARFYLIHLKNRFRDIGMLSEDNILLKYDCTNKELIEFNFENKSKEWFK